MGAWRLGTLTFVLLSTVSLEAEARAPKIAVLPAKLLRSARGLVDQELVDDAVLAALDSASDHRVVGKSDIDAVLGFERQKDLADCDDSSCLAEIGGALGAEYLVDIKLSRSGTRWDIAAKIIRLASAGGAPSVDGRLIEAVTGSSEDLLTALPALLRRLVGTAGLTLRRADFAGRRVLVWVIDLGTKGPADLRVAEDVIIDAWSGAGFDFVDQVWLTGTMTQPEVRALAAANGASLVIAARSAADDLGPILGTQMHALRASVSLRVLWADSGVILATASGAGTVGHIDPRTGMNKALRKACLPAAQALLAKLEREPYW